MTRKFNQLLLLIALPVMVALAPISAQTAKALAAKDVQQKKAGVTQVQGMSLLEHKYRIWSKAEEGKRTMMEGAKELQQGKQQQLQRPSE